MINLLPHEDKRQLAAARSNTLLLRYTILFGLLVVLLMVEIAGSFLVLSTEKTRNEQAIQENEKNTASYNATKASAATFATNLSTAKYILDQQVPYTAIILKLAAALPEGSALDKISIDPTTFGTPTTLTVQTISYPKAVEIKSSLQQSGLFSEVSFQSVTEGPAKKYPFTATYNVTYSKDLLKKVS